MKKLHCLFLLMLILSINLSAGWVKTYGGRFADIAYDCHQTNDNGYILVGIADSPYGTAEDIWLIKTNEYGDTTWTKFFVWDSSDMAKSLEETSDGGYIIVGHTFSLESNSFDLLLIKTDSLGNKIWDKTFGGVSWDIGNSVQPTSDGGYIVTGFTNSYGAGSYDLWLLKTDCNGNLLWSRTLGGSGHDFGESIQPTTDGGYIIVGTTCSYGSGLDDIWLIKLDSLGDSTWAKAIGGSNNEFGKGVQQTTDGGYIITGAEMSDIGNHEDVLIIKTDENGDILWEKIYGDIYTDMGEAVQQTADGGYIVGGYLSSNETGKLDFWLIKTDYNGDTLWTKTFGEINDDKCYSVEQTADRGYILAGYTFDNATGNTDIFLVKTDEHGVTVDEIELSHPHELTCNICQISENLMNFEYILPQNSRIELNIYDISGRLIISPLTGFYTAGNHNISFSIQSQGIYFFSLKINQTCQNGKFTVF